MIYAKWYVPVAKIHQGSIELNEIDCVVYRGDDENGNPKFSERKDWLEFYKADGGATEILKALDDPESYNPSLESLREVYYSRPNTHRPEKKLEK